MVAEAPTQELVDVAEMGAKELGQALQDSRTSPNGEPLPAKSLVIPTASIEIIQRLSDSSGQSLTDTIISAFVQQRVLWEGAAKAVPEHWRFRISDGFGVLNPEGDQIYFIVVDRPLEWWEWLECWGKLRAIGDDEHGTMEYWWHFVHDLIDAEDLVRVARDTICYSGMIACEVPEGHHREDCGPYMVKAVTPKLPGVMRVSMIGPGARACAERGSDVNTFQLASLDSDAWHMPWFDDCEDEGPEA